LGETGKVGIAKVIIKTRQYLAAVKPHVGGLVLELMHFSDELIDSASLQMPKSVHASKGEIEMAKTLVSKMTEKWDPEKYKDDYRSALLELIEKKLEAGEKGLPATKKKARPATNVIDLVEVLQKSLAAREKKGGRKAAPAERKVKRKKAA